MGICVIAKTSFGSWEWFVISHYRKDSYGYRLLWTGSYLARRNIKCKPNIVNAEHLLTSLRIIKKFTTWQNQSFQTLFICVKGFLRYVVMKFIRKSGNCTTAQIWKF